MYSKILPIGGLVALLSIGLAGSVAAGGSGYGGPGQFRFTDSSAYANFIAPTTMTYSKMFVDRGRLSFKQGRTPGAPVVEIPGTMLNVYESSSTGDAFGCWVIPDSSFVIDSNLSKASLKVVTDATMDCPGYFVSSGGGGKPGLQSAIAYGGSGGGGGGGGINQLASITVDLQWASTGGIWSNHQTFQSHCQTATSTGTGDYENSFAVATGSMSGAGTSLSDPLASYGTSTFTTNNSGTLTSVCNPYGF